MNGSCSRSSTAHWPRPPFRPEMLDAVDQCVALRDRQRRVAEVARDPRVRVHQRERSAVLGPPAPEDEPLGVHLVVPAHGEEAYAAGASHVSGYRRRGSLRERDIATLAAVDFTEPMASLTTILGSSGSPSSSAII